MAREQCSPMGRYAGDGSKSGSPGGLQSLTLPAGARLERERLLGVSCPPRHSPRVGFGNRCSYTSPIDSQVIQGVSRNVGKPFPKSPWACALGALERGTGFAVGGGGGSKHNDQIRIAKGPEGSTCRGAPARWGASLRPGRRAARVFRDTSGLPGARPLGPSVRRAQRRARGGLGSLETAGAAFGPPAPGWNNAATS